MEFRIQLVFSSGQPKIIVKRSDCVYNQFHHRCWPLQCCDVGFVLFSFCIKRWVDVSAVIEQLFFSIFSTKSSLGKRVASPPHPTSTLSTIKTNVSCWTLFWEKVPHFFPFYVQTTTRDRFARDQNLSVCAARSRHCKRGSKVNIGLWKKDLTLLYRSLIEV